ncbi:D-alanyl-D-alanine carboxypeptidase DacB precursor [bacterium BMS3Bbin14]|nr:D-alanyl-D-alanine carboxypeptidase DacB precursor [bacterium BMS3Bbin14]
MSIRPATVCIGKLLVKTVIFAICFFPVFQWQSARAACGSFSGLIRHGSYAVADAGGRIISSCNADTPLVPASILKIPTALAALHILGQAFRFRTDFFIDQRHNLYIKGYGDPMLTSEEVALVLHHLRDLGVDRINGIFIDDSNYKLSGQIPGRGESDNPYDAAIGAVAVNFNTVKIRVDGKGMVVSDEPQTPTLPLMKQLGQGLGPGVYRLNICWKNCRPEKKTARYAAELFRGLQRRTGIPGDGPLGLRRAPTDSRLVYTHRNSKKLAEVLSSLLKYSNNLIADQVFLACGTAQNGFPATWDKARAATGAALRRILGPAAAAEIGMVEGSGLSRRDRMTARAMIRVLRAFAPYRGLLPEKKGVRLKSGTLEGVYNYAGYLPDGRLFVIMLNQPQNTRDLVLNRMKSSPARAGSGPYPSGPRTSRIFSGR